MEIGLLIHACMDAWMEMLVYSLPFFFLLQFSVAYIGRKHGRERGGSCVYARWMGHTYCTHGATGLPLLMLLPMPLFYTHPLSLSPLRCSEWVGERVLRPLCRSALLDGIRFSPVGSPSQPTNQTVEILHESKCSLYVLHLHYSALAT